MINTMIIPTVLLRLRRHRPQLFGPAARCRSPRHQRICIPALRCRRRRKLMSGLLLRPIGRDVGDFVHRRQKQQTQSGS